MSTSNIRAARRRAAQTEARAEKKRLRSWRTRAAALGIVATVGLGSLATGTGVAFADDPPPAAGPGIEMDMDTILGLLDNEMITDFVEMCRTGMLASNPGSSQGTKWNAENTTDGAVPPDAIASCEDSKGHGLALVLPDRFEIGHLANSMTIDTGDNINIPLIINIPMGERNLFELISGLLFDAPPLAGLVNVRSIAEDQFGISADPRMFDMFKSYDEVATAANLPPDIRTRDVCIDHKGAYVGNTGLFGCGLLSTNTRINAGQDINNRKRNMARQVLEFMAGDDVSYPRNSSVPIDIPTISRPKGTSTIKGEGINVALSMRGGNALAETGNDIAVALAGADHGRLAQAYAMYGIAIAADMDLNDVRFTWFGQDVDFAALLPLLESDMAKEALGEDADLVGMLGLIGQINGNIPALKEVFCYGVNAKATAEAFGSCSNFLGTFDTYKDQRSATAAELANGSMSRQESQAIQDVSSLIFGNDALLKNFLPMLSGGEELDLGALLGNPTVLNMLTAVLSEEQRLKLGKDFIRYTKNITTEFDKEQATDSAGNLLWDDVMETVHQKDDDGNLLYVLDGQTVAVADGEEIPEGAVAKTVTQVKQQQATDDDGNLLWEDDEHTVPKLENVQTPKLKNRTAARMVGVTEDAWERYTSDEPVWDTPRVIQEQAKDTDGVPVWIVDDEDGGTTEVSSATQPAGGTPKMVNKKTQDRNADGVPIWLVGGQEVASWTLPTTDANGNAVQATPKIVDATEKVAKRDATGKIIYQEKIRYYKKPVMEQQTDADGNPVWRAATDDDENFTWFDEDGNQIVVDEGEEAPDGAEKRVKVMVQKTEQAKDSNGNLIWDPVVAKTVTAHWLTSDYGLR